MGRIIIIAAAAIRPLEPRARANREKKLKIFSPVFIYLLYKRFFKFFFFTVKSHGRNIILYRYIIPLYNIRNARASNGGHVAPVQYVVVTIIIIIITNNI